MLRAGKWISTRDLVGFGFLEITNRAAPSCLLFFFSGGKTILNFIKPSFKMIVSFQCHHSTSLSVRKPDCVEKAALTTMVRSRLILNLIQFLCLRAVKCRNGADMRLHTLHDMSGSHDLRLGAKTQHPRKELRADHHIRPDGEVGRAVGDDEYPCRPAGPERHLPGDFQTASVLLISFAGEHTEGFCGCRPPCPAPG